MGRFRFEAEVVAARPARRAKAKAPKAKIDPRFLAAGRELRDRYLEHVNANGSQHARIAGGKYDLCRDATRALPASLLPAA